MDIKGLNLKIKLSSIVFGGILLQIISTQGILTYNVFNFFGFWELKKFLHPIGMLLVLIPFFINISKKRKLNVTFISVILFFYLFIHYIIVVYNHIPVISLLYSVREVVVLFLMIVAYSRLEISTTYLDIISKLLIILVILNISFVILNIFIGGEAYMMLMTGRFYWPKDPLLNFKISTFMGLTWRSPGLVGESAAVGVFGVFSFFFILHSKYKKYFWLPIILVFLSFTRSVYLIIITYYLLKVFTNKKYLKYVLIGLPTIVGSIVAISYSGLLSLASFWMRIDNWINKVDLDSNILYGGNLANIGTAAPEGIGFAATMDSYWLFVFHGLGIVGVVVIMLFLFKKIAYTKDNLFFLIGIFVAGLFITYTQSIPFLVFLPLLAIKSWWKYAE